VADAEPLTEEKFRDCDIFECAECGSNKLYQRDRMGGYGCFACGNEGHESDMPNVKGVKKEDVAAAVRYDRERLLAFWENQHRASIKGEAEEIELLLEKHDVPEELEECLRAVANQLQYEVTNGEFETVVDEIQDDAFGPALNDTNGD